MQSVIDQYTRLEYKRAINMKDDKYILCVMKGEAVVGGQAERKRWW